MTDVPNMQFDTDACGADQHGSRTAAFGKSLGRLWVEPGNSTSDACCQIKSRLVHRSSSTKRSTARDW
jgi:hypothetical protein